MGVLRFQLQLDAGENSVVYVVGNIPELGNWKALDGLELGWNPKHIWEDSVTVKESSQPIEYKYVMIRQRGIFQDALWEDGANRVADPHGTEPQANRRPSLAPDLFRFGRHQSWVNLGPQGIAPASFSGKRDGQRYTVRLLRPDDGDSLGEFFTGLSEATLKRYQPHEMTAGHARYLCEQQREPSDTLRFVVTTAEPGGSSKPKIVGYMIVDFAIPHYEVERYARYGITDIKAGVDCSYAPVVADQYQGRGIAFDAMQCVFAQLKGARNMLLLGGVQDSNDRAKAFYRKLGFQEVGGYHGADNSYNVDMVVKTR